MKANISNQVRKAIYRREGFACALCDDNRHLQIHHVVKRSQGGSENPQNLICLCMNCHALVHGTFVYPVGYITKEEAEQAVIEYLADLYAPDWNPWSK